MNANPIKSILEVLKDHPEGLALKEIAKITKMNRMTVAKYVQGLVMANKIAIKKIGPVKICYLDKILIRRFHDKK